MDLSLIIPLYNEEDNCRLLYTAILRAVEPLGLGFEIIFVDDGSSDRSLDRVVELAEHDARVRVIKLRRNYGQTPAMVAGIDHAEGRVLITMDGDLQNDPADIPNFLAKIEEGYDIVVGWRQRRQDKLLTRKVPSRVANWLIGKVTGVPIKDNGCSLKAYKASVIKRIPLYSEMHRFIPAMSSLAGAKIAEIKVSHHARRFGESKYGLSRIYKVLLDLITIKTLLTMADRPLYFFGLMAFFVGLIGMTFFAYVVVHASVGWNEDNMVLAALAVMFGTTSLGLLTFGMLGEYIYRSGDVRMRDFAALTPRRVSIDTKSGH